ncbi:putative ribonuclease H-like domain-containing protein [Tanacetum coccineum]
MLVQVYVDDIIFGSTKKSLCVEFEQMMHKRFQMSSIGELTFFLGLQVKQKDDGIFISQDKYVADILKKFDLVTMKTASTLIETNKALLKDEEAKDVDVHLYRLMIGSLMYLTVSRPDIIYLKGQPKLGLWYPRDSPFDLEAFSNSDYAGASLDRKSTIGCCQFLGKRLISWQCKKQTIVANSTTKAKYVVAANCYGQVLWIQNQMLDYGFNFMNTKIYIDNESTICIVKNPVFHSKTKHIKIRHHFIRDSYEKRLIQVIKIHTDHNVDDLLIKAFDVSSISDEFRLKTGGCKVNAARQDLVLLDEKKSEGNADFHEILDFLTASTIHYALTVSPTIYASYIKQFWNTAHSQIVNNVKQIHAIVDGKTVVISELSVRSDLHFHDEDGITCLTNDAIFENLTLMGYESDSNKLTIQKSLFSPQWKYLIHTILHCLSSKSTSWNEFSTNIAFAVICLANAQKFNFSKLIFDGMLRNLDTNKKKFLMYPRFLQLFLNNQITLVEPFNDVYQTRAYTKKVFTNMKRKEKDFSGRVTPLFASMLAPPVVEGEGSGQPSEPQPTTSTTQPRIEEQIPVTESSSPQNTQSPRQALQEDTQLPQTSVPIPNVVDEAVFRESERASKHSYDSPLLGVNTLGSDEERLEQHELMDNGSCLRTLKTAQDLVIQKLKNKVKRLEKKQRARTPGMKLFKIGTSKRKSLDKKNVSKQGRKSDKTKPMFEDSDFAELDMENVEGDAETQERNTVEHGDTVNTASIDVSVAGTSNVSTADPFTSTAGDIFKDKMMTIVDTLVAIRITRLRTTSVVIRDIKEEPRRATPAPTVQSQDKGKGKMVEPEPTPKNPIKTQIQRDAEIAQQLFKEE